MDLIFQNDKYEMNWFRQDFEYAKVTCPETITATVKNSREGELLKTEIVLKNHTEKPVMTSLSSIGIYFPLEDKYESSSVCITKRCHTHIFCGENVSYIMALRMGGEVPHLGMVLTEGSLGGYSVERDLSKMSNDRGCFILHPSPMELLPGEEKKICWTVFPHDGREDFEEKLSKYSRYVKVEASSYVIYPKESCKLRIQPSFEAKKVLVDGKKIAGVNGCYEIEYSGAEHGRELQVAQNFKYGDNAGGRRDIREKVFQITVDDIQTTCKILVQEDFDSLAKNRCHFIAEKQQYHGRAEGLRGAYLIYDNEEEHIFYGRDNDMNAGRERVGMGLAIAEYLQQYKDAELEHSFLEYLSFVKRELLKGENCEVCNDYGCDNSYERLYNMPWYATLFVEAYQLYGGKEDLVRSCKILKEFYRQGGTVHYPIELPILSLNQALVKAGMEQEREEMTQLFRAHADSIAEIGVNYPPFEVNYEQSIVAPAANVLLQTYLMTGEERYLEAGKQQLDILELFNGRQPDYHQYETAIRHWDGYWFGKKKLYGDTYPHYWSGLTGNCFALYYRITGDEAYKKKANDSLRSVLSLILPDGRGSCAYVFPVMVNGVAAQMYDPYANDQDWALYFNLRMKRDFAECMV